MNYIPLEGIRTKLSSMSFGMDDKYDRLIRKTTILLILLGALIIASNRHFGTPISCASTELSNGISQYWVDNLCWITDKKFAPIQIVGETYLSKNTSFYQCTVETLIFITILMLIPGQLWKIVLTQSGYHLKTTYTLISVAKQAIGRQRTMIIEDLARHLETSRLYHRLHWNFDQDLKRRIAHLRLRRCTTNVHRKCYYQNRYFIPIIYLLIKILYIIVIITVYFIIGYCLGFDYIHFGLSIIKKISFNHTSTFFHEQYFPQRTWCQISRPKLGGIDRTWADCILPINIMNNIIFSLLWFWLMLILLSTTFGFIQSTLKMMPFSTYLFLGHHLKAQKQYEMHQNGVIFHFIEKCPPDVILMLRLYEIELGKNLTGEIIAQMFLIFKADHTFLDDSIAEHLP